MGASRIGHRITYAPPIQVFKLEGIITLACALCPYLAINRQITRRQWARLACYWHYAGYRHMQAFILFGQKALQFSSFIGNRLSAPAQGFPAAASDCPRNHLSLAILSHIFKRFSRVFLSFVIHILVFFVHSPQIQANNLCSLRTTFDD
jgi:hypothetical protein